MDSSHSKEDTEALWLALSDLFLDTETRWSLPRIAGIAVKRGFTWPQVKFALEKEVAPVVGPNLLSVAGEWAGFEEDWLFKNIRSSKNSLIKQGAAKIWSYISREQLQALEKLYQYLDDWEASDADELQNEIRLLSDLLHLHLEKDWMRCFSLWSKLKTFDLFPLERVQASYTNGIIPQNKFLLWSDKVETDPTEAKCAQNWERYRTFRQWHDTEQSPDSLATLEELSYFYTVEDLFSTPRGNSVAEKLASLELPRIEKWVTSPAFSGLHGSPNFVANNFIQYQKLRSKPSLQ